MLEPKQIIDICERAGNSRTKIAKRLKLSPTSLYQWKRVPEKHVDGIVELSGGQLTKEDIRPDLFGKRNVPALITDAPTAAAKSRIDTGAMAKAIDLYEDLLENMTAELDAHQKAGLLIALYSGHSRS